MTGPGAFAGELGREFRTRLLSSLVGRAQSTAFLSAISDHDNYSSYSVKAHRQASFVSHVHKHYFKHVKIYFIRMLELLNEISGKSVLFSETRQLSTNAYIFMLANAPVSAYVYMDYQ